MYRIGLVVLGCLLLACNGNDDKNGRSNTSEDEGSQNGFDNRFKTASLPYQLTDTSLLNNKDTASLPAQSVSPLLADTLETKLFGRTKNITYTPLAKVKEKNKATYYLIKGTAGSRKAALLLVFDKEGNFGAATPFLVPDNNASTSQVSSIDKSYSITKSVLQQDGSGAIGEGKEVLAYDAGEKRFSLIMTDLLNDHPDVLVNPIDTFPGKNKFAGDYYLNKNNLIAIRDGRYPNQILVYIHTEDSKGECRGELKGEFIITSSTTAVYRQGGDPCVLNLTFSGNSVTMNEESGCGNYRGLDCPLTGTFTRKKAEKPSESTKKANRTKRAQ